MAHERGSPRKIWQGAVPTSPTELTTTGLLPVPTGKKLIIKEIVSHNEAGVARVVKVWHCADGGSQNAATLIFARNFADTTDIDYLNAPDKNRSIVMEAADELWADADGADCGLTIYGMLVEEQ